MAMIGAFTYRYLSLCRKQLHWNRLCGSSAGKNSLHNYERKSPLEHVLLRPEMYIGQIASTSIETWKYSEDLNCMENAEIVYSPALLKIFDEILVNAADNRNRDKKMDTIKVDIIQSQQDNALSISISNNGKGIPVAIHPTENIYIPDLVFGHLLTGSNFNDSEVR